ncbi:MAG: PEP/pyruvate-binding domain-containing protein [Gemmatimonadota bacterium]
MPAPAPLSTGFPGLDQVLTGLRPGDNVVWQVASAGQYAAFAAPFQQGAGDRPVHYFRFARHASLLKAAAGVTVHSLEPSAGFEGFIAAIHRVVEASGREAYHVFDCLSGLAADWYSDAMLGSFFRLTCPFVLDVGSVAYFAMYRSAHSPQALDPVMATAQIVIDVYEHQGRLFVHPRKVDRRHSPTMHLLHLKENGGFTPVTLSATVAEVLTAAAREPLPTAEEQPGIWRRTFVQAEEVFRAHRRGEATQEQAVAAFEHLLRMAVARDGRMLELARQYLSWEDAAAIGQRLIGTGLIGGKSVGVLLARAILRRGSPKWHELLEAPDSYYVGSDVFYSFLVDNGIWWARQKQRDPATFLEDAELARERILHGAFPEHIREHFARMLDYFGQSPFIVRSSSLLEDNFGNAFAGKYESTFCPNQGSRDQRLEELMAAVRLIYASTMSEGALRYRAQRGLLAQDEQMALLVQRVSGSLHGQRFYPHAAGVALSYNPYAWNKAIDPRAGLLRLVFGLGTRAVDRADDDYTRIVALNVPEMRPESGIDQVRRYTQRMVDVLDLGANRLVSEPFERVGSEAPSLPLDLLSSRDAEMEQRARERRQTGVFARVLTFEGLLKRTTFPADMREMLATLQAAYQYPVDVEFTVNFLDDGAYRVNVVQCRPLQVRQGGPPAPPPAGLARSDILLESRGAVIGQNRQCAIDRLVYVVPAVYGRLTTQERYAVARLIGRLTRPTVTAPTATLALLGPGRWGTSTPALGIPISFAEIDTVSVLCEIVAMREGLTPDVSLGTHFFNDLIEADMLYLALFPERQDNSLNYQFLESAANRLTDLVPEAASLAPVVRVIDAADWQSRGQLRLHADSLEQWVLCYWQGESGPPAG